jgi:hypothetical protein
MGSNSGKEVLQPVSFLPANAHVSNLTIADNVAYALTTGDCGGAPSGLWSVGISGDATAVASWKTGAGEPVGAPVFGSDGRIYVAVGKSTSSSGYANAIVSVDPKTMIVQDWFTDPVADFSSSPLLFKYKEKDLIAAVAGSGRVFLLDSSSLGGTNHRTPLYMSEPKAQGAPNEIATWEEANGARWLIVTSKGAITASKLADLNGAPTLQQAWTAKDLGAPIRSIVVNGVVFIAASGGRSNLGTLWALDGTTGKELWNSGKALAAAVAPGALWSSVGQVHTATVDGTLYTFGFPMERY